MSGNGRLFAIEGMPQSSSLGFKPWPATVAAIGICLALSACGSDPQNFETVCPARLPQLNGHLAGLPPDWTVATGALPVSFQTLEVGLSTPPGLRGDREDRLPNGDILISWFINGYSPYAICSYSYTRVWLLRKIPDNMVTCQYIARKDEKARLTEPLKCSAAP